MAKSETSPVFENGFADGLKEVFSWQVKASLFYFDQALKVGQSVADFYQTRVEDGVKLGHVLAKNGVECASEYRRGVATLAEKAAL